MDRAAGKVRSTPNRRVLIAGRGPMSGYRRGIGEGIIGYREQRPEWWCISLGRSIVTAGEVLLERRIDGVLACGLDDEETQLLRRLAVPCVVMEQDPIDGFPTVRADNRAVGEMAAKYFLDLGFEHLAFWGITGAGYADQREAGFRELVGRAGRSFHTERTPVDGKIGYYGGKHDQLPGFLRQLPKPVAVFCDNLNQARDVLEACVELRISVPEELAILGVDADEFTSRLNTPELSYIDQGGYEIGYRSCQTLERMMSGRPGPKRPILIKPADLVERHSTNTVAISHPQVAEAVRIIRREALHGLRVEQILDEIPIARRTLEMAFKRVMGRTIQAEITRARLDHARRLLRSTTMPQADVAARCGFSSANRLSKVFRREEGTTPRQYRLAHAAGAARG